jgi:hypothetical protein
MMLTVEDIRLSQGRLKVFIILGAFSRQATTFPANAAALPSAS